MAPTVISQKATVLKAAPKMQSEFQRACNAARFVARAAQRRRGVDSRRTR